MLRLDGERKKGRKEGRKKHHAENANSTRI